MLICHLKCPQVEHHPWRPILTDDVWVKQMQFPLLLRTAVARKEVDHRGPTINTRPPRLSTLSHFFSERSALNTWELCRCATERIVMKHRGYRYLPHWIWKTDSLQQLCPVASQQTGRWVSGGADRRWWDSGKIRSKTSPGSRTCKFQLSNYEKVSLTCTL